jgi:acyl-CoA synthetase (AMP-forming)/AMP-acid ligase II
MALEMLRETFLDQCRNSWRTCDSSVRLRLYIRGALESTNYADLAERCAATLAGFETGTRGEAVLLLLPHSTELFLLHLGLILDGRCPAILPWPTTRIDARKYLGNLVHQLRQLPVHRLITVPEVARALRGALPYPIDECGLPSDTRATQMFAGVSTPFEESPEPMVMPPVYTGGDQPLFLQFSGGTTGEQKCVAVTAGMLTAQLERLHQPVRLDARDGVVSWLPLYHDMGLVACLWFPLWSGASSLHMAPADWVLQPELLFRFLEEHGTYCWQPNFAPTESRRLAQSGRRRQFEWRRRRHARKPAHGRSDGPLRTHAAPTGL